MTWTSKSTIKINIIFHIAKPKLIVTSDPTKRRKQTITNSKCSSKLTLRISFQSKRRRQTIILSKCRSKLRKPTKSPKFSIIYFPPRSETTEARRLSDLSIDERIDIDLKQTLHCRLKYTSLTKVKELLHLNGSNSSRRRLILAFL